MESSEDLNNNLEERITDIFPLKAEEFEEGCGCGGACGCGVSEEGGEKGHISVEHTEFDSGQDADVVIGDGVLSLIVDKEGAFAEIYQALRHHGKFQFSDIMVRGEMPEGLKMDAELSIGCLTESLKVEEYIALLEKTGFEEVSIVEENKLELPDSMLHFYLPPDEVHEFREGNSGMYNVTLLAEKPCCHAGEEGHVCGCEH